MAKEGTLLIVDDNRSILAALRLLLEKYFARVLTLPTPNRLATTLREEQIDVILLDMNFTAGINTGNEGIYWLSEIHARRPDIKVVLFHGIRRYRPRREGNARRCGGLRRQTVGQRPAGGFAAQRLQSGAVGSRGEAAQGDQARVGLGTADVLGRKPRMARIREIVEKVAATDANILITGENGTGKEMLAREIHNRSARSGELMVSVDMGPYPKRSSRANCSAMSRSLHRRPGRPRREIRGRRPRHAFPRRDRQPAAPPAIETADGHSGRAIFRVGSNTPVAVDIRLICATNRDLFGMVARGEFREDLLYRINTIHIDLPPLRQRPAKTSCRWRKCS